MTPSPELDPQDLALSELQTDLELGSGPIIDSSDEFPLPSFDFDEFHQSSDEDPNALFPDVPDVTAEEHPPVPAPLFKRTASLADIEIDSIEFDFEELPIDTSDTAPPVNMSTVPASQDDDYFQDLSLEGEQSRGGNPPNTDLPRAPEPTTWELSSKETTNWLSEPEAESFSTKRRTLDRSTGRFASHPIDCEAEGFAPTEPSSQTSSAPRTETRPFPENEPAASDSDETLKVESVRPTGELAPVTMEESEKENDPAELHREQWAEEVPVEQYVQRAKLKRQKSPRVKFRSWIPGAGVVLVVGAFFISGPVFAAQTAVSPQAAAFVVASDPRAEVYDGERLLGTTPLAVTSEMASGALEVRKDGYASVPLFLPPESKESDPVEKVLLTLNALPVALDWSGVPPDSEVWWNGARVKPASISEVSPGDYTLKVKPKGRPAVVIALAITARSSKAEAVSLGALVQQQLARQPALKVALTMPKGETKVKEIPVVVKNLDSSAPYSHRVTVLSDGETNVTLPSPGRYKIAFDGDASYKSQSKTVELEPGGAQEVTLALVKQPVVVAPTTSVSTASSTSAQSTYRPPPPVYRPVYTPPSRPSSVGGGGGGRIAPPAF